MRDISGLSSFLSASVIEPFFSVDLMFDVGTESFNGQTITTGPLYLWSGQGNKTIDGNLYIGTGNLLSISDVSETSDVSAAGANLTLSGIPSDLLALALTTQYSGRICKIKFGVIASPIITTTLFIGYMDQMNIKDGAETAAITISVESKMIDLERPRINRYTSESQKSKFPNDLAFDFIPDLQDKPLSWGRQG
jgi:hypothetical protein